MTTAICPGSFDPITNGHLNIVLRAAEFFDEVVICIVVNSSKSSPMFTAEEKLALVEKVIAPYPNIRAELYEGLLTDFCRKFEKPVLVKGLREASDSEYELMMNAVNKRLFPELETLFFTAAPEYRYISSTVVRELAYYGSDLKGTVPDEIISDIEAKAEKRRKAHG